MIDKIPKQGKIEIISNGIEINRDNAIKEVIKSSELEIKQIDSRGWLMDVLNCMNKIKSSFFSLEDMYKFEYELQIRHPENHNVKPKIRQQLQLLRDKGFVEFLGNGKYKK